MGGATQAEAKLIEYPDDPQFGKASPGKIGMWIFLVTDAMSFSGLLLAYAAIRSMATDWPIDVPNRLGGVGLSGFMTFLLICSSVSMVLSIDACKMRDRQRMLRWLMITIIGGFIFLGLQVYEYTHLINDLGMGFNTYTNPVNPHLSNPLFGATFFSITGFHGLHVFTGVMYLCVMYKMAYDGKFDNGNYNILEIAGLFWHFVDLVWILVFTFVYLL